jgi:hypothetical protein
MKGYIISKIATISLGEILLELQFELTCSPSIRSITLSIAEDGESIVYQNEEHPFLNEHLKGGLYNYTTIESGNKEHPKFLALLGEKFHHIKFGYANHLLDHSIQLHYFQAKIGQDDFLFFNNGDEGCYSFDNIEEILAHDIYGCSWAEFDPTTATES